MPIFVHIALFLFFNFLHSFFLVAGELDKNLRDPFFPPTKKDEKQTKLVITLLGVVQVGEKMSAFVSIGNQQKTVSLGDRIGEFIVHSINLDEIVLKKGKEKLRVPYLQKERTC